MLRQRLPLINNYSLEKFALHSGSPNETNSLSAEVQSEINSTLSRRVSELRSRLFLSPLPSASASSSSIVSSSSSSTPLLPLATSAPLSSPQQSALLPSLLLSAPTTVGSPIALLLRPGALSSPSSGLLPSPAAVSAPGLLPSASVLSLPSHPPSAPSNSLLPIPIPSPLLGTHPLPSSSSLLPSPLPTSSLLSAPTAPSSLLPLPTHPGASVGSGGLLPLLPVLKLGVGNSSEDVIRSKEFALEQRERYIKSPLLPLPPLLTNDLPFLRTLEAVTKELEARRRNFAEEVERKTKELETREARIRAVELRYGLQPQEEVDMETNF
jgi:hypothetical protein